MRVTKFQYPLENNLIPKLDLMIKRCEQRNPKKDAVLLIEGAEGEGKTGMSVAIGYYVSDKTGRKFGYENIFSDLNKMIKFLQDNEGAIAVWDEPALQALSGDALSTIVKDLKRMLMMCRCKRHFIMINMTYFNEFGNYIVWQRPLGMIHVYSRNEKESGRFVYIKKRNLESLWLDWKTKKKRNYFKYMSKHIRGTFPDVLNPDYKYNVLSDFDFASYEKNKNESINMIGNKEVKVDARSIKINFIRKAIELNNKREKKYSNEVLSEMLGVNLRTFYRIKATCLNNDNDGETLINNNGDNRITELLEGIDENNIVNNQHTEQPNPITQQKNGTTNNN